jgi:hypothetical protein
VSGRAALKKGGIYAAPTKEGPRTLRSKIRNPKSEFGAREFLIPHSIVIGGIQTTPSVVRISQPQQLCNREDAKSAKTSKNSSLGLLCALGAFAFSKACRSDSASP